jgi:signal transduction histidine kinase
MKKTRVLWVILDSVVLLVFNAFYFILGGPNKLMSDWISYGFIHFAYIMLIFTPLLIQKGRNHAVFGFSLYYIASFYFIIELLTGIIFLHLSIANIKIIFLVQLLVAGIYLIMFISHLIANKHTSETIESRQKNIDFVKKYSSEINNIINHCSDVTDKKSIEKIYDALYTSPVRSHEQVTEIENTIINYINELRAMLYSNKPVAMDSIVNELLNTIDERNRILKMIN